MMKTLAGDIRLYLASAWYSYRALYAWQRFGPYISVKLAFPLAQMLLFLFMGRLAGLQDPLYIVIGNILLLPATNGVAGVSMTIGGERDFRTLPYLIASPAVRGPLFLGRSLVHFIDALFSTIGALLLGVLFFHVDLTRANLPLTALCILLLPVTSCGLGLILGSLSLRTRDRSGAPGAQRRGLAPCLAAGHRRAAGRPGVLRRRVLPVHLVRKAQPGGRADRNRLKRKCSENPRPGKRDAR